MKRLIIAIAALAAASAQAVTNLEGTWLAGTTTYPDFCSYTAGTAAPVEVPVVVSGTTKKVTWDVTSIAKGTALTIQCRDTAGNLSATKSYTLNYPDPPTGLHVVQ